MDSNTLISKIMSANSYRQVFTDVSNFQKEYQTYAMLIHPDKCDHVNSQEAFAKLSEFKDIVEKGYKHTDELSEFRIYHTHLDIVNTVSGALAHSNTILNKAHSRILDPSKANIIHMIPTGIVSNKIPLKNYVIPMSNIDVLPQEHVNWILNRMLLFAAWMEALGIVHAGLTPQTIYIVPETHGIYVPTFYHSVAINDKLSTLSGTFKHFYPEEIFKTKTAHTGIDTELVKRCAAWLLGDKSGNGIKFKKTHNKAFIEFLLKYHSSAREAHIEYLELLKDNFPKKFYELTI